ncbi:MAG: hypothetical protein QM820_64060 [Minicystis sp.]
MLLDRFVAAVAVIVSALAAAGVARAGPPARTSSLGWSRLPGAESCIAPRALAVAVERRLGRAALVPPAQADVAVEGRIERLGNAWRATILLTDGSGGHLGTRELASHAADCRALDDEIALVIALLIDPAAALAPRPPPRPDTGVPLPLPVALPAPSAAPSPTPWRFGLTAGSAAGFGLLPRVAAGFVLRAHLVPPRWPAIVAAAFIWPGNAVTAGSIGADFTLAYGALSVCPGITAFDTVFEACGGVHVGALRVGGLGFPFAYTQEQPVFDLALEGRVRRRLVGPLLVIGGASLVVPLRRDRFVYFDAQGVERDVFQMSRIAGVLDLGLGLELP